MHSEALGRQRPAAQVTLVSGALLSQRRQRLVHVGPMRSSLRLGRRLALAAVRDDTFADAEQAYGSCDAIANGSRGRLHGSS
jgi:hypothetical protein